MLKRGRLSRAVEKQTAAVCFLFCMEKVKKEFEEAVISEQASTSAYPYVVYLQCVYLLYYSELGW